MSEKAFNYDIKKHIATLSQTEDGRYTTEVNLISYNGAKAKLDIRKWDRGSDKMLKGIALSDEEAEALKLSLQAI